MCKLNVPGLEVILQYNGFYLAKLPPGRSYCMLDLCQTLSVKIKNKYQKIVASTEQYLTTTNGRLIILSRSILKKKSKY